MLCQVGSDRTQAEVQAVKDHAQHHRGHVKVVQGDWLRQCGQERRHLPAVNGFLIPLATLTAPLAPKPASDGNRGVQPVQGAAPEGEVVKPDGAGAGEEKQNEGELTASQAPVNQALKGFW